MTEQSGLFEDEAPPPDAGVPVRKIYVHFEEYADVRLFAELLGQPITTETRYLVYPPPKVGG